VRMCLCFALLRVYSAALLIFSLYDEGLGQAVGGVSADMRGREERETRCEYK